MLVDVLGALRVPSPSSSWTQMPNIRRMLGDSNRCMVSTSFLKTFRSSLEAAWTENVGQWQCVAYTGLCVDHKDFHTDEQI